MTSNSSAKALVRGWSKVKRCLKGMGNCALAVTDEDYLNQENAIPVILELNGTSELVITNQISKTNDGNQLVFDKDTSIPTSLANILGKESIIIISGSYPTSFDVNKNGQTVVKISVK